MSPEEAATVDRLAAEDGVTSAEIVRRAISSYYIERRAAQILAEAMS